MIIKRGINLFLLLFGLAANFACNYNSFEKPNANVNHAPPTVESQKAAFENDLRTMETADLKYVFVFRRTDGGAFDGEDKKFLRTNLPTTNRVIMSDEGKAFIAGSNYKFPAESVAALQMRFKVEQVAGEKSIE